MMEKYKYPLINIEKTGEWLRYLCKRNNITVTDIQEKLRIGSNQAVYAWFNGKALPSLNNMLALSDLMGVKANDMVVDNVHEHPFLREKSPWEKRMTVYAYRVKKCLSNY